MRHGVLPARARFPNGLGQWRGSAGAWPAGVTWFTVPARRQARPRVRRQWFTLLETIIVIALLALVLALAGPRIGRLPARLQAEQCLSSLRAVLDEAGLRARATGQSVRLTLVVDPEDGASRFVVSPVTEDSLAAALSGLPALSMAAPGAGVGTAAPGSGDSALLPGVTPYSLPRELVWEEETVRSGTVAGEDGPAFVFLSTGEAGGPPLEFQVGKRHYRLDVDRLTGRADIRPAEAR